MHAVRPRNPSRRRPALHLAAALPPPDLEALEGGGGTRVRVLVRVHRASHLGGQRLATAPSSKAPTVTLRGGDPPCRDYTLRKDDSGFMP